MSNHIDLLQKAREQMVKARRSLVDGLAKPYDSRTTPTLRTGFLELQTVIEQIDKAIADEQKLAPPPPAKGFPQDDRYKPYNE